jgi:hypothetical protein
MWTLPKDVAFTIRRIEKPLADMIRLAGGGSPERVSIQITPNIKIEIPRYRSDHAHVYNVYSGELNTANVVEERHGNVSYWARYARYWTGTLGPCELFLRRDSHIVTIFVHQLWLDELMKGELEVARDAILQADKDIPPDAYKIAKELLPFGHGLFVALIRKERGR